MHEVSETKLPGVGVRHEFTTEIGERLGVLVHHDGRRELLVYDRADPDACSSVIDLTHDDSRTLSELLGASQVVEEVSRVQHEIEGLAIEWIHVPAGGQAAGRSIGDGEYRTRTGASVVALIRGDTPIPAPGPERVLEADDTVVAVGTAEGLDALQELLRS
ncbi:MAG: cation:proton antiporter regulatory subunit [Actinomycetota bacterium]